MKAPTGFFFFFFFFFFVIIWKIVFGSTPCGSPQYIAIGSAGVIQCSFSEDTYSLLWYNSTNFLPDNVVLTLEDSVKSGQGFVSGKFDIHANGSLIIRNVSLKHEEIYTVIKLDTPTSKPVAYTVSVSVIAQTFDRVPVIDRCFSGSDLCFEIFDPTLGITCTVNDARPTIPLSWMVRTIGSDQNISSELLLRNETYPFVTSRVTTTEPFAYSSMLTLLVCKADGPPGLFQRNESLLLLQNIEESLPGVEPKQIFVEENSKLQLNCTNSHISYLVWQMKQYPEDGFKRILYAAFVEENWTYVLNEEYKLHTDSSVVVDRVSVHHDGTYRCISGNGFEDHLKQFDVTVFEDGSIPPGLTPGGVADATPDPPNLVVDGCNHESVCVLEVQREGSLTCKVKRIRPQVDLDINVVFEQSSNNINFYDKQMTTEDNGGVFDVLITSKYLFNGAANSRLTAECKVVGTKVEALQLSTKFDLMFMQGTETTTEGRITSCARSYWITAIVVVFVLVVLVVCRLIILKVRRRRVTERRKNRSKRRVVDHETISMLSMDYPTGKKDIFISELKAKYQDLYNAVQPVPYIRDRLYCVDRVFVEGGIEYLVTKGTIQGQRKWEKLSSYHDVLKDERVKSKRRIIEGEPGFGKSTLTLQLCYDWCNKTQQSYLKDTEVLVLLRLRQLGGVTSVFRAIKQFLLPKDSRTTESDVEDIIRECSSVLVVLDGYDEYPDRDSQSDSDIDHIIMRQIFQQYEVILTTRSSYLPKKYAPITKRLRLTGFDRNARDQYIRKSVVGDDVEAADKIKQNLKENPVLCDLCQVPLFFVMFAHMSHESTQFLNIHSVTSFFRYMISCFHSHVKNKMEDENVKKYDLLEANHTELSNIAFEGLCAQKDVWSKKDMCDRLGQDFFDQYVRIGILVEEDMLDISSDPTSVISEHIQYKTVVRFYHSLFSEWFAAHYLSDYASRDDVTFDPWQKPEGSEKCDSNSDSSDEKNITRPNNINEGQGGHYLKCLDPFNLQYVYRFTCGLNHVAAEKIIGYLKTREDARKIAIFCNLEKSGKGDNIQEEVESICSQIIAIHSGYSLLSQRSSIQLLKIAVASKIIISHVWLHNCYTTVDLSSGNNIQLKSSLSLQILPSLIKLTIYEVGREIIAEEFKGILQYSSKCLELKELEFRCCLLPQYAEDESVSVLRKRNVQVTWYSLPHPPSYPMKYRLNLRSCYWEYSGGGLVSDDDYQRMTRAFRRKYSRRKVTSFPHIYRDDDTNGMDQ